MMTQLRLAFLCMALLSGWGQIPSGNRICRSAGHLLFSWAVALGAEKWTLFSITNPGIMWESHTSTGFWATIFFNHISENHPIVLQKTKWKVIKLSCSLLGKEWRAKLMSSGLLSQETSTLWRIHPRHCWMRPRASQRVLTIGMLKLKMSTFYVKVFWCGQFLESIEFVALLLFYVLVFWLQGIWDFSSPTRDWTYTLCIDRESLNHWSSREVPTTFYFYN